MVNPRGLHYSVFALPPTNVHSSVCWAPPLLHLGQTINTGGWAFNHQPSDWPWRKERWHLPPPGISDATILLQRDYQLTLSPESIRWSPIQEGLCSGVWFHPQCCPNSLHKIWHPFKIISGDEHKVRPSLYNTMVQVQWYIKGVYLERKHGRGIWIPSVQKKLQEGRY